MPSHDPRPPDAPGSPQLPAFLAGGRAILPLLIGVVPFGLAYAVSARSAGLDLFQTQLMSLAVFAGGAQFSAVGLIAGGAGPGALLATTVLINARHLLYGLTLSPRLRTGWRGRLLAATFLTDEAFAVGLALGHGSLPFLLGAELTLFASWNLSTLLGALGAGAIPDPAALGLDLIAPLTFLFLLLPRLASRRSLVVALAAALATLVLGRLLPGGVAVLLAALGVSLAAAALPGEDAPWR